MKAELRKTCIENRSQIDNKENTDLQICDKLINSSLFAEAKLLLMYAALSDEVNLDLCIAEALSAGKRVALPVCRDSDGNMDFYEIRSLDCVGAGLYNIREPDTSKCTIINDFENSVCLVPGVAFDKRGYRIGYGKGYYDRFLKNYSGITVGVCYNSLILENIPNDRWDIPVDYLLTQDGIS
jgi:5-formyltetrahydrofolate cyclo-ligase